MSGRVGGWVRFCCAIRVVRSFIVSLSANKHKSESQTTGREHAKRKSAGLHDGFSMELDVSAAAAAAAPVSARK